MSVLNFINLMRFGVRIMVSFLCNAGGLMRALGNRKFMISISSMVVGSSAFALKAASDAPNSREYSLTTYYPNGGSQPLSNSLGARFRLTETKSLSAMLVFSNNTNNKKDKSIFGFATKFQNFFSPGSRAQPYLGATAYVWKPSGKANKPNDKAAFGLMGLVGAEIWLIPELSVFGETGIFMRNSHETETETEFGTFTSAIGLNLNFDL